MGVNRFRQSSHAAGSPGRAFRGAEAALCAGAVAITALAALILSASAGSGATTISTLGIFAGLTLAAHLAVRRWAPSADPVLLPCVVLLNGLGLVLIDRLDHENPLENGAQSSDAAHQLIWTGIGIVLFAGVLLVVRDHTRPAEYGYTCGLAGLGALLIPALLPSQYSEVNGGKSWILLHGFSIQPGEFAKVLLLIFVASFLVANRELFTTAGHQFLGMTFPRLRDLGPLLLVTAMSLLVLMYEKNLGFSLLVFGTVLAMIYIATDRVSWLVIGFSMFAVGATIAYMAFPHVRVRVEVWQDPFATYYTSGYQISQALFGMATGGLLGTGIGAGRPQEVPFAKTDFIISTIGEELGLIGLAAVISVFAILTVRGFVAALATRDAFGKLLGGGLAFSIGWQLFVVVGGVTKLIPLTGLTTPFMSYGGSSLLANYIIVALLIRISHDARTAPPPPAPRPAVAIAEAQTQHVSRRWLGKAQ
ncbi:FtsW/RodA/SpoVE family cell cycle protein [Nocardia sp. NPDC058058]|uniref:FtsW/RodA/SpoVE family cell cycle protein n=1 Tax=Nocardia sp. NPDC058058 TaxID=3346317 RepID=UPI0036DDF24C